MALLQACHYEIAITRDWAIATHFSTLVITRARSVLGTLSLFVQQNAIIKALVRDARGFYMPDDFRLFRE